MKQIIKVAACQMDPKLGDVTHNLAQAKELIEESFKRGAKLVILPEFFTTGIGYHPSMVAGALPLDDAALALLVESAKRYNGYVGGSFIAIKGEDRYNTFVLARPDGTYAMHDKDIPTMWENCYFRGGNDDGIIKMGNVSVGAVICFEYLRWKTARRLKGKVDLVVGGSAWWGYPKNPVLKQLFARHDAQVAQILHETPSRFACILGVPVVCAAFAGNFTCNTPYLPIPYHSYYASETQIVDGKGEVLARMSKEDGMGAIVSEVTTGYIGSSESIQDSFWISKLPWTLKLAWKVYNFHGMRYYKQMKAKKFALER